MLIMMGTSSCSLAGFLTVLFVVGKRGSPQDNAGHSLTISFPSRDEKGIWYKAY